MANIPVNATNAFIIDNVTANGQTVFAFDFRVDKVTDIFATYSLNGVDTPLIGGVNFTVAGLGTANGGAITLVGVATAIGGTVTIYRDILINRLADYQADLFATDINAELDKYTMILQEFARDIERSIKVALGGDSDPPTPDPNKVLGWNAQNQLVNFDPATFINAAGLATLAQGVKADKQLAATVKVSEWMPGRDYSLPAGYGAGTAAAINGAIAGAAARGGGEVVVPMEDILCDATLDNKYANVLVKSKGTGSSFHDAGAPAPKYGTRIIPTFAGTVLKHRTPYAAEVGGVIPTRNIGGGFEGLSVVGNGIATCLYECDTVSRGIARLYLQDCVGAYAANFKSGLTGTDIAEFNDIQSMNINLDIRLLDPDARVKACGGVKLGGSNNANTSYNDMELFIQHMDGRALFLDNADNNLINFRAVRGAGGAGDTVYVSGPRAGNPFGGYENIFTNIAGAGRIYMEGTDTEGVTAGGRNHIYHGIGGNGTPQPLAGTGSAWKILTDAAGVSYGNIFNDGIFKNPPRMAVYSRAALPSAATYIHCGIMVFDTVDGYHWCISNGAGWQYPWGGVMKTVV